MLLRSEVYDVDRDAWKDMSEEGERWTSGNIIIGDCLLIATTYGDGRTKAYDTTSDMRRGVEDGGVPIMVLKWSYIMSNMNGEIYVVGSKLEVGLGMIMVERA